MKPSKIFNGKTTNAFIFCLALAFSSSATFAQEQTSAPLKISINDAIMMSLHNNISFQSQKLDPRISALKEQQARSTFDPSISADLSNSNSESVSGAKSRDTQGSLDVSKKLESGAQVSAGLSSGNTNSGSSPYTSRLSLSYTQPIMEGAGTDVVLADLRQAALNMKASEFELRGYAESLVTQVIDTCWDYALAGRQIEIYEESLNLAKQQLEESSMLVEVGKQAEVELVAAKAEVALREQSLINVRNQREKLRLKLLRLITAGEPSSWDMEINITDLFSMPEVNTGAVAGHVETALKSRPDLNQARLSVQSGDISVVKTKNGLLPYMAFFVNLGGTGYSGSFGGSYGDVFSDAHDLRAGVNLEFAVGQRNDKAKYEQSLLSREQTTAALRNLEMLTQEEVRSAWLEVDRAKNQIAASGASAALLEEKLRAETEKYRVGRSTSLNVAQAQRDLLQGRLSEAQAISDYTKALAALYGAEGALLEKYGLSL